MNWEIKTQKMWTKKTMNTLISPFLPGTGKIRTATASKIFFNLNWMSVRKQTSAAVQRARLRMRIRQWEACRVPPGKAAKMTIRMWNHLINKKTNNPKAENQMAICMEMKINTLLPSKSEQQHQRMRINDYTGNMFRRSTH